MLARRDAESKQMSGTIAPGHAGQTRIQRSFYAGGNDKKSGYRLVSRQPAASASSTEQNQRVPLLTFIWIFAYQRLEGW
jgi:hypothetical protein